MSFLLTFAKRQIARATFLLVRHQGAQGLSGGQNIERSKNKNPIINNKAIFIIHHKNISNSKYYFPNNFPHINPPKISTVRTFFFIVSDDKNFSFFNFGNSFYYKPSFF